MPRCIRAIATAAFAAGVVATAAFPVAVLPGGVDAAEGPPAAGSHDTVKGRAAAARAWLASIRPALPLQEFLDDLVADLETRDLPLRSSAPRIAVIDLTDPKTPRLAQVRGDEPVYPASVVKFVYLMAAYAWREQGRLRFDAALEADLDAMIRRSSNSATQAVFRRITGTSAGPELEGREYETFRRQRVAIDAWLSSLGINDLHAVNPTYDGGGDLFGRDRQFLRDRSIGSGAPAAGDEYVNRNAMTASGTARLLALLATDRALSADDSRAVRERMKRDVREQPHLSARIAGGVATMVGCRVFTKSGTWGPIFADAGIVRNADGREFALAVFTESTPAYRGDAIARLANGLASHLFHTAGGAT